MKILPGFVLVLLLGVISSCRTTAKSDSKAASDDTPQSFLGLFCDNYEGCREQFLNTAKSAGAGKDGFKIWQTQLPGNDEGLTMDFAFFPAADRSTDKILIMTSGIHGLEGPTGSTLQTFFIKKNMLTETLEKNINVLFVHGINSHGFKYFSRYTKNRVDLNRNWFVSDAFPNMDDKLYDKFNDMLNPTGPAAFTDADYNGFLVKKIIPYSSSALNGQLTRAAGQGQYRYKSGLEYGGNGYEPHRKVFLEQVGSYLTGYKHVMHLDLHTGLGDRKMQLLPNAPINDKVETLRQKIFVAAGGEIASTGGADFYSSFGDFSDFVCGKVYQDSPSHDCVNMLIEYGTLIETYWNDWPLGVGAAKANNNRLFTLYLSIRENQMTYFGARTPAEGAKLKQAIKDLFYPKDPAWRVMVLSESMTEWPKYIDNFAKQ